MFRKVRIALNVSPRSLVEHTHDQFIFVRQTGHRELMLDTALAQRSQKRARPYGTKTILRVMRSDKHRNNQTPEFHLPLEALPVKQALCLHTAFCQFRHLATETDKTLAIARSPALENRLLTLSAKDW